jgi:hypothetical protein
VDQECDEEKLEMLEKARNTLMHGGTLKEIEKRLPGPREEVVDTLGKIVFLALVNQFPRELFTEKVKFLKPSSYIDRTLSGIAHMQTVVPVDADAPPQSARPFLVVMTKDQYEQLTKLSYKAGDHQEMCRRIAGRVHQQNETHVALVVFATDFARIDGAIKRKEAGEWQELFREVMGEKGAPSGGGS